MPRKETIEIEAWAPTEDGFDVEKVEAYVTFDATFHRAEPDVGYMSDWYEIYTYELVDHAGNDLWKHNNEEEIIETIHDHIS